MSVHRPVFFNFVSRDAWSNEGVNDAWHLTHCSVAKWNSDDSPYLIPNEWICGRLALVLGLPVPPFALFKRGPNGKRLFASLQFGSGDPTPPDTDPTVLADKHPELCTGIILFDILIANADRHVGNISVDSPGNPKEVHLFDHDHALFGTWKGDAEKRLNELQDRMGVAAGSVTGQTRHCLLNEIKTSKYFGTWIERIFSIPKHFIEDACTHVIGLGIRTNLAKRAIEFLDYRRRNMASIVESHANEFPSIKKWEWL